MTQNQVIKEQHFGRESILIGAAIVALLLIMSLFLPIEPASSLASTKGSQTLGQSSFFDEEFNGVAGQAASNGIAGSNGINGTNGSAGIDGVNGNAGQAGTNGLPGSAGAAGLNGENGVDGKDGSSGANGLDGKDGTDGKDGKDGKDGESGQTGEIGPQGESGLAGTGGFQIGSACEFEGQSGVLSWTKFGQDAWLICLLTP